MPRARLDVERLGRFPEENRASWVKKLLCEGMGSMILVFFGLGAVAATGGSLAAHAFAEGAGYFVGILMFDLLTGAHLNPAITLAMAIYYWITGGWKRYHWVFLGYPIAQYIGAVLGVLLVWPLTGTRTLAGLGAPVLAAGVSDGRGFGVEVILLSILAFVFVWTKVMSHADDGNHMPFFLRAFAVLFVVIGLVFVGCTVTGANLNPMRYLAVITVAAAAPTNWWVWTFAPFVGSLAAALLAMFALWVTLSTTRLATADQKLRKKVRGREEDLWAQD